MAGPARARSAMTDADLHVLRSASEQFHVVLRTG